MENQFRRKLAAFLAAVMFTTSLPVPVVAEDSMETTPVATVETIPETTAATTSTLPTEPETVPTTVPVTEPVTEPATEPEIQPEETSAEEPEKSSVDGLVMAAESARTLMMAGRMLKTTAQDDLTLAAPVVTAPDSVQAGEEIVISWEPVENAEEYVVMLYWIDGTYIGDIYYGKGTSATISRQLEAGEYSVTVLSRADGWENGGSNVSFTVTGELPAAPGLKLDAASYTVGSKIAYTITAEDAATIRQRYYGTAEEGYNSEDTYEFAADGTTTVYERDFYTAGSFNVVCSAKVNGIWSAWSEIVMTLLPSEG